MGPTDTNETRCLAEFALNLRYADLPQKIRALAVDLLVDQIGCQLGGAELPWAQQVLRTIRAMGGTPQATVFHHGGKLPIGLAAFVNSTFGHSFEYDDANPFFLGHPGAELIPPLFAIAELNKIGGKDFLAALVAAHEVRGRAGWAVCPDMSERGGPQFSTACGVFGAAAGVAKLMNLDGNGLHNAMAIAGSYSGGLMQYDQGGGSVKRIHTAIAASSGIQAAQFAAAGLTGPEAILEGSRGLLRIYSSNYRPERLTSDLGSLWTLEHVLFKAHSCCAVIHPAIDALRKIITSNSLQPNEINAVEVKYPKRAYEHAAISNPQDLLGLQFSTSYSLAITALKGANTPREYSIDAIRDPAIRAFASKVTVRREDELSQLYPGRNPARVKVCMRNGNVYEQLITDPKGSRGAPLSSKEIDDKFRSQVSNSFGTALCEEILSQLRAVENIKDLSCFVSCLVRHKG